MEFKGQLEGFPKEIVEKMLDYQHRQGNKKNISIFENNVSKGFIWDETEEGYEFWEQVIKKEDFYVFFKKYPRTDQPSVEDIIEMYKDVHSVACVFEGCETDISNSTKGMFHSNHGDVIFRRDKWDDPTWLYSVEKNEYAEIVETKKSQEFKEITSSIHELLKHKNKQYGNAALEPLNIFSGKCKVGQRIDDKLARVRNSESLRKNDIADLMGYLVLTCTEKGWNNFNEFMD